MKRPEEIKSSVGAKRIILRKGGRLIPPVEMRKNLGLREGSVFQVRARRDEVILRVVKR